VKLNAVRILGLAVAVIGVIGVCYGVQHFNDPITLVPGRYGTPGIPAKRQFGALGGGILFVWIGIHLFVRGAF
jgi:hypothetical protein